MIDLILDYLNLARVVLVTLYKDIFIDIVVQKLFKGIQP